MNLLGTWPLCPFELQCQFELSRLQTHLHMNTIMQRITFSREVWLDVIFLVHRTANKRVLSEAILYFRTPAYSSPECFCAPSNVSFPADIWSLAATLFHLVSGRLPFEEQDRDNLIARIVALDQLSPDIRDSSPEDVRSSISSAFASVIARGMAKLVENRHRSAEHMARKFS